MNFPNSNMPNSAPHFKGADCARVNSSRLSCPHQSGFTLIEIMVVVVIIAVMSLAVSLSLGGTSDRTASLQANRFMAVLNEIRDEAIIAGQDYALIVDEKNQDYRFVSARDNIDNSVDDILFKIRKIDPDVKIKWEVFEVFDEEGVEPKVLISSLGELTPFELSFKGESSRFTVFLNDEGELERRKSNTGF